jgi:hypothetical protein
MKKIPLALMIVGFYGCNTTRIIDPLPTDVSSSLNIEDVYYAIMLSLRNDYPAGCRLDQGRRNYEATGSWWAGGRSNDSTDWCHDFTK